MGVSVIISQETEAVTQGLNQRNNSQREQGPCKGHCVTNDFASRVTLWITPLNKVYLRAIPWGLRLSTLHFAMRTPRLPHPPLPTTPVTSVRNKMIYHTNIPFSTTLIALISLLTFPTIPPACIFHAWPRIASMHPQMIVMKTVEKKGHLFSQSPPGDLCATIMFMFQEFRGWPIQPSLSLHIFLSTWRYRLQRERDERHPAASPRSQARRALI